MKTLVVDRETRLDVVRGENQTVLHVDLSISSCHCARHIFHYLDRNSFLQIKFFSIKSKNQTLSDKLIGKNLKIECYFAALMLSLHMSATAAEIGFGSFG